jgi:Methyltransferase domain
MAEEETRNREIQREKLLSMMPKGGIVAEIGVWKGEFSHRILDVCKPEKLHLIDPWQFMPEFRNTCFGRLKNEFTMDDMFDTVKATFAPDKRVVLHRDTSEGALEKFADHSLDWVYVDGNHNEPYVSNDIALCLKKVKLNGVIAGDDFNWKSFTLGAPVRRAVEAALEGLGDHGQFERLGSQWIIRLNRPATMAVQKPAAKRRAA